MAGIKKKTAVSKREKTKVNHSPRHQKYKVNIPIAYLYMYYKLRNQLKKRSSFSFMQTSEVLGVLKLTLKLPRKMKYVVLGEMEAYGLIKRINHQRYWISDKKVQVKEVDKIKQYLDNNGLW